MHFTVHAVEQYVVRCRPELSYPAALAQLKEHLPGAHPLRRRTDAGDELYCVPALHCRLVVKRERGQLTVVTVLAEAGPIPEGPPAAPADPEQGRRDALHDLRNYLDRQAQRGDRRAERVAARLRSVGVL